MTPSHPADERGDLVIAGLKRLVGYGENPLEWSLPFAKARGVVFRIHLVFLFYVLSKLIWSISSAENGLAITVPLMGALIVSVVLHELGHLYAAKRVGGSPERVILWPLGGLVEPRLPDHWRASFMTALGGPFVSVSLWVGLSLVIYVATQNLAAVFYLPHREIATLLPEVKAVGSGTTPTWLLLVWCLHFANTLVLLFNLLPMFPMDGGRVVHAGVWHVLGKKAATEFTAVLGILCGGALAVFATAGKETELLAVAGVGIWVCYQEHKRIKFLESGGEDLPIGVEPREIGPVRKHSVLETAAQEPDAIEDLETYAPNPEMQDVHAKSAERAEIDRILAKISTVGMDGLTPIERETLQRASQGDRETE